ncbi:MAG: PH domain-containing protein [Bacteroides sp.]|nr:PH domain-containing protein [Eubacterium sp.]MCM1419485.1 PH domain-containing protein [Roseburia sp.]MCM1463348.1 PH domain-containing protein [Bacteroides sp.]
MNLEKLKKDYGEVIWAGRKCICGLPISFTRYILTDTTLFTKIGLFNIREDEIELYRIFDKKITFTFFQRLVKCGTIALMSKDSDTPVKYLVSIRYPREAKKILDEAVKNERDKYYVRGRDMIGGAGHDLSDHEIDPNEMVE